MRLERPMNTTWWCPPAAAALLLLTAALAGAAPGNGNGGNGGGGSGGGGGDTGGDGIRYDYEALPTVEGGAGVWDLSEDRNWVAGYSVRTHPCQTYAQGPALWERQAGGGWLLHELPGLDGVGSGNAYAVLNGGLAVGWHRSYAADCSGFTGLPVVWEPVAGTWIATALPSPAGGGNAQGAAMVDGVGVLVAGGAGSEAVVWRRIGGAWTMQGLGSLDDNSVAHSVSSSGAVVGASSPADWSSSRPFIVVPVDTDADGSPDTWYQDADGDGRNDLMTPLDSEGRALGANELNAACGNVQGATHWGPDGSGGWTPTTLPVGEYSDGTVADDLNGTGQVVGNGRRPKGRGSEQNALLWESDSSGGWSLVDLNGVTELPRSTRLSVGRGINQCGDIVGLAETRDVNSQPCILTPRNPTCN